MLNCERISSIFEGENGRKFFNGALVVGGGFLLLVLLIVGLQVAHKKPTEANEKKWIDGKDAKENHIYQNSDKTLLTTTKTSTTTSTTTPRPSTTTTTTSSTATGSKSFKVCTSRACTEAGYWLFSSLNTSVEPCQDFYRFACGGWLARHSTDMAASESVVSEQTLLLQGKVTPVLKALLESPDFSANSSSVAAPVRQAQALYKDCLDREARIEIGVGPLLEKLKSLLGFSWPVALPSATNASADATGLPAFTHDSLFATIARFAAVDVQPIIRLNPIVDFTDPSRWIMKLSPPQLGLPKAVFSNRDGIFKQQFQAYRKLLKQAFRLLETSSLTAAVATNNSKLATVTAALTEEALDSRITAVLDFEIKLAHLSPLSEVDAANALKSFSRLRGKLLDNAIIDYHNYTTLITVYRTHLLKPSVLSTLNLTNVDQEFLVVTDIEYFDNLDKVLVSTYGSASGNSSGLASLLADYFSLAFVLRFRDELAPISSSSFAAASIELEQAASGVQAPLATWQQCLNTVQGLFPLPLARLYSDVAVEEETVDQVSAMVVRPIETAFRYILKKSSLSFSPESGWLSSESSDAALTKFDKTYEVTVGYWDTVKNNTKLERMYAKVESTDGEKGNSSKGEVFKQGHYLETLLSSISNAKAKKLTKVVGKLKKEPRRFYESNALLDDFQMGSPLTVDVTAFRESSFVFIPIALLQPPFFNPERPEYLNLATLGPMFAHQLIHLFDEQNLNPFESPEEMIGRNKEKVSSWWSSESDERFIDRADCFLTQYGSLFQNLSSEYKSASFVKRQLTLNENIADNGALMIAYDAFKYMKKYAKNELNQIARLPGLEKYTVEQTFFIAHAQSFCSKMRPEAVQSGMRTDRLSPSQFRVNVPLANLESFSDAFKCPKGSALNPEKRCQL